uniref:Phenylalanine--tRNA ligase beta subunit, chloroplastic n=1 Tax=Compsopogon caeruleus TaxID=31354 RepID=A0A1Z1XAY8_9RHOD|nr:phenylalanyl-tRNA synthetase beta chain [Compsopogon caeruleus]ARX96031.1 phenylalanyl-tRNA synthetase beta chain [Compsopogon caeruleus]
MKISWNWLRSLINIDNNNPYNIAHQITLAGSEVENIEYVNILGYKDIVLDINSTPNRNDLLSVVGIAKEIGILINKTDQNIFESVSIKQDFSIQREYNNLPLYYKSYITNLVITESPLFIQQRLITSGITPVNNIVDIINYINIKWGCGIEIIDISYIENQDFNDYYMKDFREVYIENNINFIIESDKELCLNKGNIITMYKNIPVYLSGIGAAYNVKINKNTTKIYLQSINFKSEDIKKNSLSTSIRTNSSIRYERGINTKNLKLAFLEICNLINKYIPNSIQNTIFSNDLENYLTKTIKFHHNRLQNILGNIKIKNKTYNLESNKIIEILKKANFKVENKDSYLNIQVPYDRSQDILREADIIEEIARFYGFDNFIDSLPIFQFKRESSNKQIFTRQVHIRLKSLGLTEIINYSLVNNTSKEQIQLKNPLIKEYDALRSNLLEGLLEINKYNYRQTGEFIQAFEIGTIFYKMNSQIYEKNMLSGILGGNLIRNSWSENLQKPTWHQLKGKIEILLSIIQKTLEWVPLQQSLNSSLFNPAKSSTILINKKSVGNFGEIHPKLLKQFDLNNIFFAFEINFDILYTLFIEESLVQKNQFIPYSIYPTITRDISIIAPSDIFVQTIIDNIKQLSNSSKILQYIQIFDEYSGDNIPNGSRSIGLRLFYQSKYRTLTTEEVEKLNRYIKFNIEKLLPINLR